MPNISFFKINGTDYKLKDPDVSDSISDLKSALTYGTNCNYIRIAVKNKYLPTFGNTIAVNDPQPSTSGYGYVIAQCVQGDKFCVNGVSSTNSPMAWAFTDSSYNVITSAASNITVENEIIEAPSNSAYLVIHDKAPYRLSYRGESIADKANKIYDAMEIIDHPNLFNPNSEDTKRGGYYNFEGTWTVLDGYSSVLVEVSKGDKIYRRYPSGYDSFGSVDVAFYDSNKSFVSGYRTQQNDMYATVPNNNSIKYMTVPVADSFFTKNGEYLYGVIYNEPITGFVEYSPTSYSKKIKGLENEISEIQNEFQISHWRGKKWYAYGTSLTSTAQGKYAPYVAQLSGLDLYNKGIPGGALVANRYVYNALNDLTDGKVDADLITIEVGANDWTSPLGDVDTMNIDTFCGALNTSLRTILLNCPKAQVVLMCSTRQKSSDDGQTPSTLDTVNSYGMSYEERDEAIRKIAVANGVYYIPFGSGLGFGLFRMQSSNLYNVDHIHHTDLGGYNLAHGIWCYLKNIPKWYNSLP